MQYTDGLIAKIKMRPLKQTTLKKMNGAYFAELWSDTDGEQCFEFGYVGSDGIGAEKSMKKDPRCQY